MNPVASGGRRPRIGIGGMHIESSTFSPHRAAYDDFRVTRGAELLDRYAWTRPDGELAGRAEWVPLLHAVSLPGGPVERGTYDRIKGELIERLRRAGPLDGRRRWRSASPPGRARRSGCPSAAGSAGGRRTTPRPAS
ncbi:M81 family metallopeptidase [Streptomyces asiaticus]|uniref:M81 family metallopeptidase n=1 Tax=Streptomyces asiaticus TaxID=114695 RepID=UPI003F4CBEDA